jgi:predicted AAA+ superfamily ATPase
MKDPDNSQKYLALAHTKPSRLLKGDTPRLMDEWQIAPALWDAVKFTVDERERPGQFILTGSTAPPDDSNRHSGAGRIARVIMRPMTLFESSESNGNISLRGLFDRKIDTDGYSELTLEGLAEALVRGGWPSLIGTREKHFMRETRNYVEAVINTDLSKADGVKRAPATVRELLRSLPEIYLPWQICPR